MGWRRTFHYYRHRMFRGGDSTRRITAGLAVGASSCFSPFFGTHSVQTIFLCWIFRLNPIAGFIGTAFGNPWTYPIIFWSTYKTGIWLCALFGFGGFVALPEGVAFSHFMHHPGEFIHYMFAHPYKLLLPLTIGGLVCGLLFWPVAYGLLYYPVRSAQGAYRLQRELFRKHKREKAK